RRTGGEIRLPGPAAGRPAADAPRELLGDLVRAPITLSPDRLPHDSGAALRLAGADELRSIPLLQPLALAAGASSARKPGEGAQTHLPRALEGATRDEWRPTTGAHRRGELSRLSVACS